jgi:hypothetical protein
MQYINKNSGFVMLPVLLGIGLLLIGGGAGVLVTKKLNPVANESAVIMVAQDDPSAIVDVVNESPKIVVEEEKEEDQAVVTEQKNENEISYTTPSIKEEVSFSESNAKSLVNLQNEELVRKNNIAYETAKKQLKSLSVILDDAKDIAENKKSVMEREVESCKDYYDYEVETIESRWESNLSYYKSQKSYYESNSGLYSLVGTSGNNERYLEEDYDRYKEERDDAMKSAKSRYEDCKDNYEWDTTFDKDVKSLIQEQKDVTSNLTSDNATSYLSDIEDLIQEAEGLKYSLMLVF